MLRNQAKKQGGFYVCASCRHDHRRRQGLARLCSGSRIHRAALSPTSRPFSSTALLTSGLQSPRRARNDAARPNEKLAQPTTTRVNRREYASWGKFGSNMLPGQTNAAWGEAPKSNQGPTIPSSAWARGTPGAPGANIPPAPGTSALAGKMGSGIPPAPGTSAFAGKMGSGIPHAPGTSAFAGKMGSGIPHAPGTSAFAGKPGSSRPPARPTSSVLGGGHGSGLSTAQSTTARGEADPSRQSTGAPTQAAPTHPAAGQNLGHSNGKVSPSNPAPPQGSTPGRVPFHGGQQLGGSTVISPAQPNPSPSNVSRREMRPGRLPGNAQSSDMGLDKPKPPSHTASPSTIASDLASTPITRSNIGQSQIPPARPATPTGFVSSSNTPKPGTFTEPATRQPHNFWASDRPNPLGGASGTVPGKPAFPAYGVPPAKSTSGLNDMTIKSQKELLANMYPESSASGSNSRTTSTQSLDNSFTKAPSRPAPQDAEYPQLRRVVSRDDLFESTSPFDMPSKDYSPQDSAASPLADMGHDHPKQPRPIRIVNKRDNFADWGPNSELGKVAPPDPPSNNHDDYDFPVVYNKVEGSMTAEQFTEKLGVGTSKATQNKRVGKVDEPDWETKSDHDTSFQATWPQEPIENGRKARSSGDRRVRRGDSDEDMDNEPDYGRRDRGGKPKNSKNKNREVYNGEEDRDYEYEEYMAGQEQRRLNKEKKRAAKEAAAPKTILLPEYIAVYDLAEALRIKPARFLQDLEALGFQDILHDSVMTGETAALVAAEYGLQAEVDTGNDVDLRPRPPPEDLLTVPPRPPIVTIMGHVDHGKTTMLDFLRKSSVAAQEAGGITQHIGAFSVKLSAGKMITFLDTPGHAAFLTMRQRGANVTDIVVLVVAVDDSVKPQTIEAISHAKTAQVPIIVAINKIDLDPNRIDHVKQDLAASELEIEDFGGDVQVVAVSAQTGQGMRDLEEAILTLSEILDVRAEPDGMAEGWVIESSVKPDGKVATVLVKRGTLRVGDLIVAGTTYTRIRVMKNEAGTIVQEAGPGTPVEIYGGWKEPPMAGDMVLQAPDETKAQAAVEYRKELEHRALAASQKAQQELKNREMAEQKALEKMMEEEAEEAEEAGEAGAEAEPVDLGPKIVNIIVRGDVMGSVEAVSASIQEIGNNEVQPRILRSMPGQITQGDVELLATAGGCIVNFNNPIQSFLLRRAETAGVKILNHRIIYEVVADVKRELSQKLKPIYSQRVQAEAEVLQIFPINIVKRKYKNIAGVRVRSGVVTRGGLYRVVRQGENIHEGKLEALKQIQKNVAEMKSGNECGMMFEEFDDFQVGDIIQLYENVETKRYL